MKPIFPLGLVGLTLLLSSTAQGQLSGFFLTNLGLDAPLFDADGIPLGPGYLAELWGSTAPDSLAPAYNILTGDRVSAPFIVDGYFSSSAPIVVPAQFIDGGYSWLQVRAWDSRLGATYEDVAGLQIGGYGESSVFYADGANPFLANPESPATLIGLESFRLRAVVPEPSGWVLLGMGGLALVWAARRRRHP